PHEALADAGWGHIAFRGEKSYNGVAIISRLPIETQHHKLWAGKDDCRHICARINGVDIHDFYIPAGGDIADRNENPKFGHKIDFVDEMRDWFAANPPRSSVLVGDLNIA
ncbi:MAG TPA: exodeoxyribonuclease III, partial [Alphaproteobacteria bacterium]|nr:exodeoxyribonuclease III [Alphaproteobacteria bacterium]